MIGFISPLEPSQSGQRDTSYCPPQPPGYMKKHHKWIKLQLLHKEEFSGHSQATYLYGPMALGALGVLMIRLMTLAGAPEAITHSQFVGVAQT